MDRSHSIAKSFGHQKEHRNIEGAKIPTIDIKFEKFHFPFRPQGHRIDFYHPPNEPTIWNGSSSTIVEDDDHDVWGTVWEIDLTHMASLDWSVTF